MKFYDYRVWALGVAFDVRALSESDALWVATHPCKRNGGRVFCTAEQVDSVVMLTVPEQTWGPWHQLPPPRGGIIC